MSFDSFDPDHPTARSLIGAAHEILEEHGVGGLSLRAVAARAGFTTMVVYSHFGGKAGLLDALFVAGFERLSSAQRAVSIDGPPLARVRATCAAFLDLAAESPNYFDLMFGGGGPDFSPSEQARRKSLTTLHHLESVVAATPAVAGREKAADDPIRLAREVFALCYGWASLRRVGMLQNVDVSEILAAVESLCTHGLAPSPDTPREECE